jgi:putative hydrolase
MFAWANIEDFEKSWDLPAIEVRQWIALHEVAHRLEFADAWVFSHFKSLLEDFASTLQIDIESLQDKLSLIDPANPESVQSMMEGEEGLFGSVLDDEQHIKLARIQSFMAASEGYADHVIHTIGRRLLNSYGRIDEAMRRHSEGESGDPIFERLLGIDMKKEHYTLGRSFCDEVAEVAGENLLATMWGSAEAIPSMPELSEPTLWMARAG